MKASEELKKAIASSTDILNPFAQKLDFTLYDKIKIAVLSVTLFPIRAVVILIFFVIAWLIAKVILSEKDFLQKPISGYRKAILKPAVHGSLRVAFAAAGFFGVPIRGQLADPKEAPILVVAPHSSFYEIITIVLLGGPSVLAKIETSKVPIYGVFITFSQPVYVQQNDKLSRKQTVSEIRGRAFSNGNWQQIAIFPEGTCTSRSALINFKQGAFFPGVPVQPVCISYPNRLDTVSWTWRGFGILKNLWLSWCQFRNYLEIDILPVYKPSKAEVHDAKLYARNVQKVMANHLRVRTSDWSFSDIRFIKKVTEANLPVTIPVVKLVKLRNFLKIEEESLKSAIKEFEKRLKRCSTTLSDFYAFAQLLEIENCEALQELFDSVDQDKEGTIDVRSYLCCLWFLRGDISICQRIQEAFKVLKDESIESESEGSEIEEEESNDEETELKYPEFCLLLWLLLTIPKREAEKVFKSLDQGTGTVKCADFLKCLENCPSALEIINEETRKFVSYTKPVCDNEFFKSDHND